MAHVRRWIAFRTLEEVSLINSQIDEFLAQEVKSLEGVSGVAGEDRERNIVDEYLEVRDRIQEKSVEVGFYTMNMPEHVGGGGLSTLEYTMVLESLPFEGLYRDGRVTRIYEGRTRSRNAPSPGSSSTCRQEFAQNLQE